MRYSSSSGNLFGYAVLTFTLTRLKGEFITRYRDVRIALQVQRMSRAVLFCLLFIMPSIAASAHCARVLCSKSDARELSEKWGKLYMRCIEVRTRAQISRVTREVRMCLLAAVRSRVFKCYTWICFNKQVESNSYKILHQTDLTRSQKLYTIYHKYFNFN